MFRPDISVKVAVMCDFLSRPLSTADDLPPVLDIAPRVEADRTCCCQHDLCVDMR